ncbi:MAG: hypothetical protein NC908_01710 [Candidatus Omnitrophica bacterium]|nr:hypothetical protein [Candidatus Omnitrophota bacterium]
MRLYAILLLIISITALSILYVYQQTEIFRLGYLGHKKITELQELVDKNIILRYNLKKSASLINLADKVCDSSDYEIPLGYWLVRLPIPKENLKGASQPEKANIVSRLIGIKRQAEARP